MLRIILLIEIILLALQIPDTCAWDVLVVQNCRVKPYAEALQGFKTVCKVKTTELVISELNGEDVRAEIRNRNPDLILAIGMYALSKVRKIKGKPIVYLMVLYPDTVLTGEKNITGISMIIPPERQLSYLRKVMPRVKRVGLVYDPKTTGHLVARAYKAAAKMGIELTALRANRPEEFPELLKRIKGRADVFWMLPDSTVITPESAEYLILFSMKNKIPILAFSEKYLKMGAFMSVEINSFNLGKQAGEMARKILSGIPVEDIPTSDAADANISVNHIIAKKMDIIVTSDAVYNPMMAR